jgi:transcriptional regulator with XRE-family HTH domain
VPIGEYLKKVRKTMGLTTVEVAARSNVLEMSQRISDSYLSQVERSIVPPPSPDKLKGLAYVYRLDYLDLMRRAGYIDGTPEGLENILDDPFIQIGMVAAAHLSPEARRSIMDFVSYVIDKEAAGKAE